MQRVAGWFQRLPNWGRWTSAVIGVVILLGIGAAIGSSGEEGLKDDKAELEGELAAARADVDQAESDAAAAEAQAAEVRQDRAAIIQMAKTRAKNIVGDANAKANRLSNVAAEVESAEQELASIEGSIGGAEERAEKSSIPDGVWKAESDYVVGTYRATGGGGCYWEKLSSPSGEFDSIIANGGFEKNQILTIDSAYFSTSGCGTWELVE